MKRELACNGKSHGRGPPARLTTADLQGPRRPRPSLRRDAHELDRFNNSYRPKHAASPRRSAPNSNTRHRRNLPRPRRERRRKRSDS